MDITALIERGEDGKYSIFIENKDFPYGIIGTGATVQTAMEDFEEGLQEMKEYVESTGSSFPEISISFKYDIPSFLQEYAYAFSLAGSASMDNDLFPDLPVTWEWLSLCIQCSQMG